MQRHICICVAVLIYQAEISQQVDSKESFKIKATQKPGVSKTSQSNAVTKATSSPITTARPSVLQGIKLPCSCLQGQCGCCTGVILERFKQKVCLNITYEPDEFAFTAALALNERILYKNTVSGKNPPPICIRLPRFRFIKLCVEFSNIYFSNRNMHVCIDMEANWENLTLLDFSFDCIRMGVNGVAVVGPAEGGGIPINPVDEEDQTDEDYDDNARESQKRPNYHEYEMHSVSAVTRKSNIPKYINSKNIPGQDSPYDLRNASAMNLKRIPISVKRLLNGDFLITFDTNVTFIETAS